MNTDPISHDETATPPPGEGADGADSAEASGGDSTPVQADAAAQAGVEPDRDTPPTTAETVVEAAADASTDAAADPADAPAAEASAADVPAPAEAAAGPAAEAPITFESLGLSEAVVRAVQAIGYETASPIQAATIPLMLEGADVLGQAQTGTGKTAAFALPILSRLDLGRREPQALVLVPTRELAIQVAEAFQRYATGLSGFHVLPVYGGQGYGPQLAALQRGPQVIVGTPGRIIDHLERGTLSFDGLSCVVLDEADEMLAMGFADALETILSQTPKDKQVALFSATMAPNIRRIARRHLRAPQEIVIKARTATAAGVRQRFWMVSGMHKLDALTRIVEVEDFDAMLVFVRTKQSTVELAERLQARGFSATALNGDIQQAVRERTVAQLKAGAIDILVATDVAARGLDVERITHVVNFDVPYDTESYVHRIGRTGRAGRSGEAILFVAPRERYLIKLIERATRQKIESLVLPTVADVNSRRLAKLKARIGEAIAAGPSEFLRRAVQEVSLETGADLLTVASAVASLIDSHPSAGPVPTLASPLHASKPAPSGVPAARPRPPRAATPSPYPTSDAATDAGSGSPDAAAGDGGGAHRDTPAHASAPAPWARPRTPAGTFAFNDDGMQLTYRLAVGEVHGVQAGQIVGAIANEAGLDGHQINGVQIRDDHSFVRLPARLPHAALERLAEVRLRGQRLALSLQPSRSPRRPGSAPPTGPRSSAPRAYETRPTSSRPTGPGSGPPPRADGARSGTWSPKAPRGRSAPGAGTAAPGPRARPGTKPPRKTAAAPVRPPRKGRA